MMSIRRRKTKMPASDHELKFILTKRKNIFQWIKEFQASLEKENGNIISLNNVRNYETDTADLIKTEDPRKNTKTDIADKIKNEKQDEFKQIHFNLFKNQIKTLRHPVKFKRKYLPLRKQEKYINNFHCRL